MIVITCSTHAVCACIQLGTTAPCKSAPDMRLLENTSSRSTPWIPASVLTGTLSASPANMSRVRGAAAAMALVSCFWISCSKLWCGCVALDRRYDWGETTRRDSKHLNGDFEVHLFHFEIGVYLCVFLCCFQDNAFAICFVEEDRMKMYRARSLLPHAPQLQKWGFNAKVRNENAVHQNQEKQQQQQNKNNNTSSH